MDGLAGKRAAGRRERGGGHFDFGLVFGGGVFGGAALDFFGLEAELGRSWWEGGGGGMLDGGGRRSDPSDLRSQHNPSATKRWLSLEVQVRKGLLVIQSNWSI